MSRTYGTLDHACPVEWSHPLNRGLVGEWAVPPLSGWRGANTLRDLVRGGKFPHDGTLTNGPTWAGPRGRPGGYGSLALDGTNDYVAATFPRVPLPVTFAGWVNRTAAQSQVVLSHSSGGNDGYRLDLSGGNVLLFTLGAVANYGSALIVPTGWAFVAASVTGDAGSVTLAVGTAGKLATETAAIGTSIGTPSNLYLGQRGDGVDFFAGSMDGLTVYGRALSVSELRAFYDQSRRGNPDRWRWRKPIVRGFAAAAPVQRQFNAAWANQANTFLGGLIRC